MKQPLPQVVIVADDPAASEVLPAGHDLAVHVVTDAGEALAYVSQLRERSVPSVLVLGRRDLDAAGVLLQALRSHPDLPVIVAAFNGASQRLTGRAVARTAGSPALVAEIRQALRAAAQQNRVRTTLDRLNVRLRGEALAPDPRHQRTLLLSRLYLSNFVEQARVGLFVTDRSGIIALWNPAASRLFEGRDEDMTGRRIDEAAGGHAGTVLLDLVRRISPGEAAVSASLAADTMDGTRDVEVSLSLVSDSDGNGIAVSGIVRDVTERQAMLRELQERAAALEASNRHKDDFLAILSHELRTPLNAVLGWTQILSNSPHDEQRVRRGLKTIARNAELQRRLVEDLLDYARIAAGRLPLDCRVTDVTMLVREAVDAQRPSFQTGALRIVEEYEPAPLAALVDPERLQQVLANLLTNAVKFTGAGGEIRISVRRAGDEIVLTVSDTGHGIAPEFLPYVFEAFRQEDSSTTRTEAGLGLGLAISRRIVELHGGSITAASEGIGRGAVLTVIIPAAPPDPEPGACAAGPDRGSSPR